MVIRIMAPTEVPKAIHIESACNCRVASQHRNGFGGVEESCLCGEGILQVFQQLIGATVSTVRLSGEELSDPHDCKWSRANGRPGQLDRMER